MYRAEVLTWQWDSELSGRFHEWREKPNTRTSVTFSIPRHPIGSVLVVSRKPRVVEIDCYAVRRELSNYLEDDLTPQLRFRIEGHLENCSHCTAVYAGMRNVVRLLGDEKAIELPTGFSQRLFKRLFSIQ